MESTCVFCNASGPCVTLHLYTQSPIWGSRFACEACLVREGEACDWCGKLGIHACAGPEDGGVDEDHYADFVQCGECAEWHSESLGCHKCRLLKRSYAIEGLEEAELRLLIDALPRTGETAELRQILTYAYNEVVAESFDGWPSESIDPLDGWDDDEPF